MIWKIKSIGGLLKKAPTRKISQITAHLFLGGQYDGQGLKNLKETGITAIVNMRMHSIYREGQYDSLHYLHLPTVDDTAPVLQDLIKGAEFTKDEIQNGGTVYIHCRQGIGRGPTMAIAYLMKMGATFEEAFKTVKKARPSISPTRVQIQRLKELESYFNRQDATVRMSSSNRQDTPVDELIPKA